MTALCLDYRRLGKQRVETKQIIQALERGSGGWVNHPATKMWADYKQALILYGMTICKAWRARGYKDKQLEWFSERLEGLEIMKFPPWLFNEEFHASHRSNLLRKDPEYYGKFGWKETPDLPYIWPVK